MSPVAHNNMYYKCPPGCCEKRSLVKHSHICMLMLMICYLLITHDLAYIPTIYSRMGYPCLPSIPLHQSWNYMYTNTSFIYFRVIFFLILADYTIRPTFLIDISITGSDAVIRNTDDVITERRFLWVGSNFNVDKFIKFIITLSWWR